MKTWAAVFNLFAIVIIAFLMLLIIRADRVHTRGFEELRLRYAMDYAVEAAFRSTLSVEDIGIDYTDIDNVTVNPSLALETFQSLICLSYNMSLSTENFAAISESIPTGVLFTNDGYYMLEMQETDTTSWDGNDGGEYKLTWSVKKPYTIDSGNYLYAVNIYNEQWTSVPKTGAMLIEDGKAFSSAVRVTGLTRAKIQKAISEMVTSDINYEIYARNINRTDDVKTPLFYLPAGGSAISINEVSRPTLLMFVQGADFSESGLKVDATSVGGARVTRKRQIAGFVEGTQKYYCYEKQVPDSKLGSVVKFFSSMEEAAAEGYKPHFVYLSKVVPED